MTRRLCRSDTNVRDVRAKQVLDQTSVDVISERGSSQTGRDKKRKRIIDNLIYCGYLGY
jgi:hypothetical protein